MTPGREQLYGSLRVDLDEVVVTVVGELDLATVGRFRALVEAAVATDAVDVTIDLAGLDFVGLCAVPVLERASQELRARQGTLTVRHAPRAAHRLFRAVGLSADIDLGQADRDADLRRLLAVQFRRRRERPVLSAGLAVVVRIAQTMVPRANGVSVTAPHHGRLGTLAASDDVVLAMDRDQYATGQGPCLDAATLGRPVHSDALAAEERWPEFVPRAQARGIQCILSTPLLAGEKVLGALNVYSQTARAFATPARVRAEELASEAAGLLAVSATAFGSATDQPDVAAALASRHVIAVAQGILLDRNGGTADDAYATLRRTSRRTGRPLRSICEDLVRSRSTEGEPAGPATDQP